MNTKQHKNALPPYFMTLRDNNTYVYLNKPYVGKGRREQKITTENMIII